MMLTDYDIECLEKARALIEKNSSLHHSIDSIAQQVGMSATRLKAGFKQHYGSGLYTYLRQQRMQLALELLADRNKTIKAIAKTTGFRHTSNFTHAFKKAFGVTPGEKRRALVSR